MASEYGGGPRTILDQVYLDEAVPLVKRIQQRRLENYKMQVIITHTGKPQEVIKILDSQIEKPRANKLDSSGFTALKFAMSQNPRIIVK